MDFNKEYADHQHALMCADNSICSDDREAHLARASLIATKISAMQRKLGTAAACAWSMAQFLAPARA